MPPDEADRIAAGTPGRYAVVARFDLKPDGVEAFDDDRFDVTTVGNLSINDEFQEIVEVDANPVTRAFLAGLLRDVSARVNVVNAFLIADERGIKVTTTYVRSGGEMARRAPDFAEWE